MNNLLGNGWGMCPAKGECQKGVGVEGSTDADAANV